jgi:hypothetical protein
MNTNINVKYLTPYESKLTYVNNMNVQDAAKFYSLIGIVTHPFTGRKTKLQNWQRLIEDGNKYQVRIKYLGCLKCLTKSCFQSSIQSFLCFIAVILAICFSFAKILGNALRNVVNGN